MTSNTRLTPRDIENLLFQIKSVDRSSFQTPDSAASDPFYENRHKLIDAAKRLVDRLETPDERVNNLLVPDGILRVTLKVGIDLNLFAEFKDNAIRSTTELATATGAEPELLRRVLRQLASMRVLQQPAPGTSDGVEAPEQWQATTDFAPALADPMYSSRIEHIFNGTNEIHQRLPGYLAAHGWQDPSRHGRVPFHEIMHTDDDYWAWLRRDLRREHVFNTHIRATTAGRASWVDTVDHDAIAALLAGADERTVSFVDVAGGLGSDCQRLRTAHPGASRVILQEQPDVVVAARKALDPALRIEAVEYDIFSLQPINGARMYHMGSVLHDWPDEKAREILRNLRPAMEVGRSRLLLSEQVVPDRGARPYVASLDFMMMALFGARERSEAEWRELLWAEGFEIRKVWWARGSGRSVIEAVAT